MLRQDVSSAHLAAEKVMDIDENDMKQLLLGRGYAFAESFGSPRPFQVVCISRPWLVCVWVPLGALEFNFGHIGLTGVL